MALAVVHSRAQVGIDAPAVTVEVHLANGLPSLSIVGLPEAAVKESKDRVRAALLNARFEFPARRITAVFKSTISVIFRLAHLFSVFKANERSGDKN